MWIELNSIEPARDQTLEEVRDAVLAAWTAEKTNEAIVAEVERITQQLEAGLTIQDAAAQLSQFPEISPAIKRDGTSELIDLGDGTTLPLPASNVLDASVANAVFAGGPGHYGAALNGDGDYVIFKVAEITPAQGDVPAETSAFIEGSAREGMFGEFVTGLRDEAVLRINQQVLSQLLGLDQPPGN